jgi:hypothetical protein
MDMDGIKTDRQIVMLTLISAVIYFDWHGTFPVSIPSISIPIDQTSDANEGSTSPPDAITSGAIHRIRSSVNID